MIKTMFRRLPIALLFCFVIFLAGPQTSLAATVSGTLRATLFAQIEQLVAEVERLQTILEERQAEIDVTTYTPYASVFFPLHFESVYVVKDAELHIVEGRRQRAAADEELFQLFSDIVGEDAVDTYVKEWRVFENESNDLGAFVELMSGTDDWVVGVNRKNFEADNQQITEAYANLFVHEYAHIIFFSTEEREEAFAHNFSTAADRQHVLSLEQVQSSERFTLMRRYYDNNETRFVGDYATMSIEEDMAESFVAFVREAKPVGTSLRDKKVRFFYEYHDLITLRTELRERLETLGVL
jgi:hypothetical protein